MRCGFWTGIKSLMKSYSMNVMNLSMVLKQRIYAVSLTNSRFKTLVTEGKSGSFYVFVIPIAKALDLKRAAKAVGEKSVEMIHVRDILKITGYIRGGCSPIGMKKQFRTVFDESAKGFEKIVVSGGRIGSSLKVNPIELAAVVRGEFGEICQEL